MNTDKSKRLPWSSEWSFDLIELYECQIDRVAREVFGLDIYPIQLEMITSEQMLDRYTAVGMPLMYPHWSFGKQFASEQKAYEKGAMGLAYEIVINSKPCIAYLMEDNTLTMQALVIAHAAYGHNSFFKNNYLFKQWTEADAIVDYLDFARDYVRMCEKEHGQERVELVLDAAHSLRHNGIDRYKRPHRQSLAEEKKRQDDRLAYHTASYNDLWRTVPGKKKTPESEKKDEVRFPKEPQENLLYFLEKHAPFLEPWEKELVRIVRRVAQYFYPQLQTQVMNEGWATFWHYTILNQMYDEGLLHDGFMEEFLSSHTSVVKQPAYNQPGGGRINPYALGFNMFRDIRRICEGGEWVGGKFVPSSNELLAEDREWFPKICGTPWRETFENAMKNYRDESFVLQFLSPKLMRDMKFFTLFDKAENEHMYVTEIHDEAGYRTVRQQLAAQYDITSKLPDIQVVDVDVRGDRTLMLEYFPYKGRALDEGSADETLQHLANLWRCPVEMQTQSPTEVGKLGIGAALPPKEWYKGN